MAFKCFHRPGSFFIFAVSESYGAFRRCMQSSGHRFVFRHIRDHCTLAQSFKGQAGIYFSDITDGVTAELKTLEGGFSKQLVAQKHVTFR